MRFIGWTMLVAISLYIAIVELTVQPDHFVAAQMLEDYVLFLGGGLMMGCGLAAIAFAEHLERLRRIEQLLADRPLCPTFASLTETSQDCPK